MVPVELGVVVGGESEGEDQQSPIPTNRIKKPNPFYPLFQLYIQVSLSKQSSTSFQDFTEVRERPKKMACDAKTECFTGKNINKKRRWKEIGQVPRLKLGVNE